jgi:protein CpxP
MAFFLKPGFSTHALAAATLLVAAGGSALAQGSAATPLAPAISAPAAAAPAADKHAGHHGRHHMGGHDPATMQAYVAQRQAELKVRLNITPDQEGAWMAYTAATQPAARKGWRMTPEQRADVAKLNTPQRIDSLRAARIQRMAESSADMDKRDDAAKALYAALTPEQQKVMDARYAERQSRRGQHHPHRGSPKNAAEVPRG